MRTTNEKSSVMYKVEHLEYDKKAELLANALELGTDVKKFESEYLLHLCNKNVKNVLEKYSMLSPGNDIRRYIGMLNGAEVCLEDERRREDNKNMNGNK